MGRSRTVSDAWRLGHPWSVLYPYAVDRPLIAAPVARVVFGTDLRRFHAAADAIGDVPAGGRVLDVPSGGGVALRGLRPGQGVDYLAVDISPAMLERTRRAAAARGVADQVTTLEADVADLPLPDGHADLVISLTGLHCFPSPRDAVRELARVLAPGGRLVLSWVPTDLALRHRPVLLAGRAMGVVGPSAGTDEVVSWLAADGLRDVDLERSGALAYVTASR